MRWSKGAGGAGASAGRREEKAGKKQPMCQHARLEAKRKRAPGFRKTRGAQIFTSYCDLWIMKVTPDTFEKGCQDIGPHLLRDSVQKQRNNQRSPYNAQTGNASGSESFTLKSLTVFDPFF